MESSSICNKCNTKFSYKSACVRHIKNGKCKGVKTTPNVERELFICDHCNKSFTCKRNCAEHIQKRVCFNRFEKKSSPEARIFDFESPEEFLVWKDQEEQQTNCKYSQSNGSRKSANNDCKKIKYWCHWSGYVRDRSANPEKRQRALKRKGSCKINNHCTAFMLYKECENRKVTVEYYPKHCNHAIEMKYLPVSVTEKEKIADKLRDGVSMDRVLDDIRDTLDGTSYSRTHLLIKHDLHNISAKYGIAFKERFSSMDAVSVELLINQYNVKLGKDTPFKYYKEQGVEKDNFPEDDFLLVIMTTVQIHMMKKFGQFKICIDSTHSTNRYDFLLTTIMVVNDIDMGVPVAHLISNRETTETMRKFFSVVKQECGISTMETAVFMTDDFPAYLNAWTAVMGKPVKNLLCTWHVDKNWRKNLTMVKSTSSAKDQVYKTLRTVMEEKDEKLFPEIINTTVADFLKYEETVDFGKYFEREYGRRYEMWAFAFRKFIGMNTNMKLEAMHRELKTVYFNGIKNKRLDTLITTLLRMNRNKAYDRVSHIVMETDSHTYRKLRNKHVSGVAIPKEDVTIDSDQTGTVISQTNRSYNYTVAKIGEECGCKLRCEDCGGICVHGFTCTCDDYTIAFNLCKHIHAFAMKSLSEFYIEDINNNVVEEAQRYDEVQSIFQVTQSQSVKELNKEINALDSIKMIAQQIQHRIEKANGTPGEEERKALSLLRQADKILEKKQQCSNLARITKKNSKRSPTKQKFEKQLRFVSTKKKNKKKEFIIKPTVIEKEEIRTFMTGGSPQIIAFHTDYEHLYSKEK